MTAWHYSRAPHYRSCLIYCSYCNIINRISLRAFRPSTNGFPSGFPLTPCVSFPRPGPACFPFCCNCRKTHRRENISRRTVLYTTMTMPATTVMVFMFNNTLFLLSPPTPPPLSYVYNNIIRAYTPTQTHTRLERRILRLGRSFGEYGRGSEVLAYRLKV